MGNITKDRSEISRNATKIPIPPGKALEKELAAQNILKKSCADQLEILPQHLSEIFSGKRRINAELAVKIEKVTGIDADYWMGLVSRYEVAKAKNLV